MNLIDWLEEIWDRSQYGWIDLPSKVNGRWVPCMTAVDDRDAVRARIVSCKRDEEDLYFSVQTFSSRRRSVECVGNTSILWADLDTAPLGGGPSDRLFIEEWAPTWLWESSPGKTQAIWYLTSGVTPKWAARLSAGMAYAVGADPSGWDLTQVLRVPGTWNTKYTPSVRVGMPTAVMPGGAVNPRDLYAALISAGLGPVMQRIGDPVLGATHDGGSEAGKSGTVALNSLPARAQALLREKIAVEGERSARLWELECLLVEHGLSDAQIFDLVWHSCWNKWRDVSTGKERLRRDIVKARHHVNKASAKRQPNKTDSPVDTSGHDFSDHRLNIKDPRSPVSKKRTKKPEIQVITKANGWVFEEYEQMMQDDHHSDLWLVDGWWTKRSYGICGGEAKSAKSTVTTALALSVATGKDFLGMYEVKDPGPALVIQAENSTRATRMRVKKLAYWYGLMDGMGETTGSMGRMKGKEGGDVGVNLQFHKRWPFAAMNVHGLSLLEEDHREAIWKLVDGGFEGEPWKFVVVDPLYLMMGGADESRATDLRPVLQWLQLLSRETGIGLCVCHHMRKRNTDAKAIHVRPGQRLSGSHVLHNWLECGLYCDRLDEQEDDDGETMLVKVEKEFREAASGPAVGLEITYGLPTDSTAFSMKVTEHTSIRKMEKLLTLLGNAGKDGAKVADLAGAMGVSGPSAKRLCLQTPGVVLETRKGSGRGRPAVYATLTSSG